MTNFELKMIKDPETLQKLLGSYFWFRKETRKAVLPLSVRLQDEIMVVSVNEDKEGVLVDYNLSELHARKKNWFLSFVGNFMNFSGNDMEGMEDIDAITTDAEVFAIQANKVWVVKSKDGAQYIMTTQIGETQDTLLIQRLQKLVPSVNQ